MEGLLLVDKPAGWTSFDVVNYVRRIVANYEGKKPKNCKVGHTGTLDPFATGLLVLVVGKNYTRRAGEFSKLDKTYEVIAEIGRASSTGDTEGEKIVVSTEVPERPEVLAALDKFTGEISQVPPAFSAIKVDGVRAYKLAREGKEVVLEPRTITIRKTELINYIYPDIAFVTEVSSGTYIRTLVEDIGAELKTGAYTAELRRTAVGEYKVEDAIKIDGLTPEQLQAALQLLS
ncbi:MAG: truB [Candidatus Saccharibacteria bacterium]|nr:truB [Candidatus Saccharibacteria bacterium]